jgi:predicted AlkP superfamily phosphohydrolase/phosphomutase
VEWGCHDRHFGFHTWPSHLADEIEAEFALHPIFGIHSRAVREFAADDYIHRSGPLRTADEERDFFRGLLSGTQAKRRLTASLLAKGGWDLFLAVFGESHAIGHQQWHIHDTKHPRFDPALAKATDGDPILQIYRELDGALGELLKEVGPETTVLVLLSHGMGPHYDGTHLLDEILTRIDGYDRNPRNGTAPERLLRHAATRLPGRLQQQVVAYAVPTIRRRIRGKDLRVSPEFATPERRSSQNYFMEPNNSVYGGVRINLAGREPAGCVAREEMDAVCNRLSDDLMALVNVDTGKPVIRSVTRSDGWHRRKDDDTMPDLFIDWERSALIETVWSPKTGVVHAPYTHWRTGDHRPHGTLLATGPGIPTRAALPDLDLEDLGPSLAGRLGVKLDDVDGRPANWLAS